MSALSSPVCGRAGPTLSIFTARTWARDPAGSDRSELLGAEVVPPPWQPASAATSSASATADAAPGLRVPNECMTAALPSRPTRRLRLRPLAATVPAHHHAEERSRGSHRTGRAVLGYLRRGAGPRAQYGNGRPDGVLRSRGGGRDGICGRRTILMRPIATTPLSVPVICPARDPFMRPPRESSGRAARTDRNRGDAAAFLHGLDHAGFLRGFDHAAWSGPRRRFLPAGAARGRPVDRTRVAERPLPTGRPGKGVARWRRLPAAQGTARPRARYPSRL